MVVVQRAVTPKKEDTTNRERFEVTVKKNKKLKRDG